MASKVPKLGGLDFDFVEEPPDSLKCLICMLVVNDPWQHGECGRVYCRVCLEEYKKVKNTCPNCRKKAPSLFKDGRSEKDAKALIVRCGNTLHKQDGTQEVCKWTGELGDLPSHHNTCPLQPIPCPNGCTENDQDVKILRKLVETHLQEDCPNRTRSCQHCGETGKYVDLVTAHLEVCPKLAIRCTNKQCDTLVPRNEMKNHVAMECSHTVLACQHLDIGCSALVQRKDMMKHESDLETHMNAARTKISSLENEIGRLKDKLVKMEVKAKKEMATVLSKEKLRVSGTITFKMANLSAQRATQREFQTPPFYTSHHGYKLVVIIETSIISKTLYLAIYAHLMRGEYDDGLAWPLVGTVTFELLNQLGNHSHKKKTCAFPPNDKDNHRLTSRDVAVVGYGCPKFISYQKLSEATKDICYLKDDHLYWRVSVDAPEPLDHDWLKCD